MAERIFRRKIYEQMLSWEQNQHGTTALLIRGARRVDKPDATNISIYNAQSADIPAKNWQNKPVFPRKSGTTR